MQRTNSMLRRDFARLTVASSLIPGLAWGQDWKAQVKEFRIGLLGGENTQDRLKRYDAFQKLLQEKLNIPIKMFPAADYSGVMQGFAAGQLDATEFSPAAFAGTWLDCQCVEPVVVPQEKDGSIFYIAAMVVRKDSGINAIDEFGVRLFDPGRHAAREGHRPHGWQVLLTHRIFRWTRARRYRGAKPAVRRVRGLDIRTGGSVHRLHSRRTTVDGRQGNVENGRRQYHLAIR
jgi:hypothetical protein